MAFMDSVDAMGIAEEHVKALEKMQDEDTSQILKTYKTVRSNLRDRLDGLPEGTFTAQQLRGVLVQIELAISAMERGLKDDMDIQSLETANRGITDLISEINKFSKEFEGAVVPIDLDALRIATDTSNFLVNRYEASIRAYSEQTRQLMTMKLMEAVASEASTGDVIRGIGSYFQVEQWRLERIARTELHYVYNFGKINGMKEIQENYIPDLKKALYQPMDSRTGDDSKQAAAQNPIADVNEPFKYVYRRRLKDGTVKKEVRTFMAPPDRPNDRSIIIPYREVWEEAG